MEILYVCCECKRTVLPSLEVFACSCGGLFSLHNPSFSFSLEDIKTGEWSLFRYHQVLPFPEGFMDWQLLSMGEGLTPILPLEGRDPRLLVKMDYLMPTLSFKDRGAVVLLAQARSMGAKTVIQDSSGNAGNAVAAYAARAGMNCIIYLAQGTSPKKIQQIQAHGGEVRVIQGDREAAAQAAKQAAENGEGFYASHVYNPFFYHGTKTFLYEVFEEQAGEMPDWFVLPVGNGSLLLGVYEGLVELQKVGLLKKMPRILAVQAQRCCPIYESFQAGRRDVVAGEDQGTVAQGIAVSYPRRGRQILEAIQATDGDMVTAPEELILTSKQRLARKGFYVEETAAATLAGYTHFLQQRGYDGNEQVLIPLTGAGLKSIH